MNKLRSRLPFFARAKDVALIEGCSLRTAEKKLTQMKKEEGLSRGQNLSMFRYLEKIRLPLDKVELLYIKVLIIIATVSITTAFSKIIIKNYFPELDEYMKRHFVFWDYTSPNHQHGHLYIKMPETGEKKKVTIDVYRTKNSQLPDWQKKFYDTVKPQNAEYPKNIPKR